MLECSFNYREGAFGELLVSQHGAWNPGDAAGVVSGQKLPSHHCTQVIVKDVMIFGAALGVEHDALEDFEQPFWADDQAGFFEHLPLQGVFDFFAAFDEAAGEGPVAFQRVAGALDQEDRVASDDQRSNARQRVLRVTAANTATLLSRRF
jgi:hypothetical protein